jgi:ABC-type amino acid transport substrate-binding protein
MRSLFATFAALAAVLSCATAAHAAPPKKSPAPAQVRPYLIECKLLSTDAKGKEIVVSSPRIMTIEDQPATVRVGSEAPLPPGAKKTDDLFQGSSVDLNVYRAKDGQVFLDAKMVLTRSQESAIKGVRLVSCGARVVEPITLGQTVTVPIEAFGPGAVKHRFEFLVREPSEDDKKPRPAAGEKFGVRPVAAHAAAVPGGTPVVP